MLTFPNAKINLGLRVLNRRPDGYHNIETCFYPIGLTDVLEAVPICNNTNLAKPEPELHLSGLLSARNLGLPTDNLCLKAWRIFSEHYTVPALSLFLHKAIPAGAGLGGGSSDAAFTLRLINALSGTPCSESELHTLAARLGADCPFFLHNSPALATQKGDVLHDINLSLKGLYCVIVFPDFPISTAEAYAGIVPTEIGPPLEQILAQPIEGYREYLHNQFELTAFEKHPVLATIKEQLYAAGAVYASMSGSGSALYGLFNRAVVLPGALKKIAVWEGVLD